MGILDASKALCELQDQIRQINADLDNMGPLPDDIPQIIESANLLRKNQYLLKSDSTKSKLIANYTVYTSTLESLLESVFEIQKQLQDILHHQNKLIPDTKKRKT